MKEGSKKHLIAAVLLMSALVGGCAVTRGSNVLVGTKRSPISPDHVKLYLQPPKQYEQIALISADAQNFMASQQKMTDSTVARLKQEAASLGANGVLIGDIRNVQTGTTGTAAAYHSKYPVAYGTTTAVFGKEGDGMAIYVTEE
jgi:uncharacterized protein YbjQ (UPF0145 family)